MNYNGFWEDGRHFELLFKPGAENPHVKQLKNAIRSIRDRLPKCDRRFATLEPRLRAYGNLLDIEFEAGDSENPIKTHMSQWQRGKFQNYFPVYLIWLAAEHPAEARAVYSSAGLKFRQFDGEIPNHEEYTVVVRGPSNRPTTFTFSTRALVDVLTKALDKTVSFAKQRQWISGGFALTISIALASLIYTEVSTERRDMLDTIRDQQRHNEAIAAIEAAQSLFQISTISSLTPSTQAESIDHWLQQSQLNVNARAELTSYLSVLNLIIGDRDSTSVAEDAARIQPTDADILLRQVILNIGQSSTDIALLLDQIKALDKDMAPSWVSQLDGIRWIFSYEGWIANEWNEYSSVELWQVINSINNDLNREMLLMFVANAALSINDDNRLIELYLERVGECNDVILTNISRFLRASCISLHALYIDYMGNHAAAAELLESVSGEAQSIGANAQFIWLELQRSAVLSRVNDNDRELSINILENRISDVRAIENKGLSFEFFRLLFSLHRDWPTSDFQAALPYGREAFALSDNNLNSILFINNNFLQLYAGVEASVGDGGVAFYIREYLHSLSPADLDSDYLTHADVSAAFVSALLQRGRNDEAEIIWQQDVIQPYNAAIENLPSLSNLENFSSPYLCPNEHQYLALEQRLRALNLHFLIDRLYELRIENYAESPSHVQADHRYYYHRLLLDRLSARVAAIAAGSESAQTNFFHYIELRKRFQHLIDLYERAENGYVWIIRLKELQLYRARNTLTEEELDEYFVLVWQYRFERYLSTIGFSRSDFILLAEQTMINFPHSVLNGEPDDGYAENISGQFRIDNRLEFERVEQELVDFIYDNHVRFSSGVLVRDPRVASLAVLARDRSGLNRYSRRDDYETLVFILGTNSLREAAEGGRSGSELLVGDSVTALNYAELWLEGFHSSVFESDLARAPVAGMASLLWNRLLRPDQALQRLDLYEEALNDGGMACEDCILRRGLILDTQIFINEAQTQRSSNLN